MARLYLKNFIKLIPYILLILGIIVLGVILAGLTISIATRVITKTEINGINVEASRLNQLTEDIFKYYFSSPKSLFDNLLNNDSIKEIIINDLAITEDEASTYSNTLLLWNYIGIFIVLIHITIAYFLTSSLIRKRICPRSIKRFIFVFILKKILDILFVNSITLLMTQYKIIGIISFIVLLIVNTIITLLLAYLSQHKKNDKIMVYHIVNHKTVFIAILMSIILMILSLVIYALIANYIPLLALIIGFPLLIYTFIIISLTPESYVINYNEIAKS